MCSFLIMKKIINTNPQQSPHKHPSAQMHSYIHTHAHKVFPCTQSIWVYFGAPTTSFNRHGQLLVFMQQQFFCLLYNQYLVLCISSSFLVSFTINNCIKQSIHIDKVILPVSYGMILSYGMVWTDFFTQFDAGSWRRLNQFFYFKTATHTDSL